MAGSTQAGRGSPHDEAAPVARPVAPGIALVVVLAAVFALAFQPLWATDIGWQLRVGRDLLAGGGIPHRDTLSWSMPGAPWVELRWLWALGIAVVERAGGFEAISWGAAIAVTLAFGLAAAAAGWRGPGAAWTPLVTLAGALAAQQRFLARPETFTFVALGAFLLVLHRLVPRAPRARWILPALQVPWTNTHTLFALGPLLVGLWALAGVLERRGTLRRDLVLLAATLAACLVNPHGPGAFAFAWLVWSELHAPIVRAAILELASPFAAGAWFTNLRWFVALLVAVPVVAALALARRRRIDAFLALATLAGAFLALTAVRNLPLFALPAIPFLVHHLGPGAAAARPGRRFARATGLVAPGAAVLLAGVTIADVAGGGFYARQGDPRRFGAGLAPARQPLGAAARLRALGVRERVFATFHESSWLLAEGFASWLDPRIEVFGAAHLERTLRAQADSAAWSRLVAEARPNAVVAGLDQVAFEEVLTRAGWTLAGLDDVAAVWLPPDRPPALDPFAGAGTATTPEGAARLAAFLARRGRPDLAAPHLGRAPGSRARLETARALEARGDSAAARRVRREAYAAAPGDATAATEWALELLLAGDPAGAAAVLDPLLARPGAPARAWALRGEAAWMAGDGAAAESCLARAAGLDPGDAQVRRRLAAVRARRRGIGD